MAGLPLERMWASDNLWSVNIQERLGSEIHWKISTYNFGNLTMTREMSFQSPPLEKILHRGIQWCKGFSGKWACASPSQSVIRRRWDLQLKVMLGCWESLLLERTLLGHWYIFNSWRYLRQCNWLGRALSFSHLPIVTLKLQLGSPPSGKETRLGQSHT